MRLYELNEGLDANQKRVGQVGGEESAKPVGPVLGAKQKQHPFKGRLVGEESEQGVAEGSDNITAVFSGYGNYMKGRAANVFKHYGITVLGQQYDEDEDIAEYTVSGSKEALDQARAYLERSDQFGGMILKQGVAEGDDKIADRYDQDEWDEKVQRLKKLAGMGPLKTVWDPEKRVYKNVPVNQNPEEK